MRHRRRCLRFWAVLPRRRRCRARSRRWRHGLLAATGRARACDGTQNERRKRHCGGCCGWQLILVVARSAPVLSAVACRFEPEHFPLHRVEGLSHANWRQQRLVDGGHHRPRARRVVVRAHLLGRVDAPHLELAAVRGAARARNVGWQADDVVCVEGGELEPLPRAVVGEAEAADVLVAAGHAVDALEVEHAQRAVEPVLESRRARRCLSHRNVVARKPPAAGRLRAVNLEQRQGWHWSDALIGQALRPAAVIGPLRRIMRRHQLLIMLLVGSDLQRTAPAPRGEAATRRAFS
mmetsp:Transcript_29560/g.74303  ORF Transcript_29560/g.74303 Transcript_29560/m.74303 type:complete len:293 (-) Transcript_29560:30-908(-)